MTRKITRKTAYPAKVAKARKMSSSDLRDITRDVRRLDWGGKKMLGHTMRARTPAARVLNARYKAARKPVSSFHPGNYSTGELQTIADGRSCEAWVFTMQRSDVPIKAQEMALAEIIKRRRRP